MGHCYYKLWLKPYTLCNLVTLYFNKNLCQEFIEILYKNRRLQVNYGENSEYFVKKLFWPSDETFCPKLGSKPQTPCSWNLCEECF